MISIFFILLYKSNAFSYKKTNSIQSNVSNEKGLLNSHKKILVNTAKSNFAPFNKEDHSNHKEQKISKTENIALIIGINIACLVIIAVLIIFIAACCKKGVSNENIGIMTDPKF